MISFRILSLVTAFRGLKEDRVFNKSLKMNAIFSSVTNFSDLLLFALMILAGRLLGPTDFGAFSFSQSLSIIFLTFSTFGLNVLITRDISRDNNVAQKYLSNILPWRIILSTIAYILLMITGSFFMRMSPQVTKVVAMLGFAVMLRFFSMTGTAVLRAFRRFDLEALAVFSEQCLMLVLGGALLLSGKGLYGLAFSFVIARACGCLLTFGLVKHVTPFSFQFNLPLILELQKKALPLGAILILTTACLQVNTLIVSHLLDYEKVGLYTAAFKIYNGLFLVPSIIGAILFPRLSHSFYANKQEHNALLVKGILCLLLSSLAIAVFGISFSDLIVVTAFGNDYLASSTTINIFFVVLVISFQVWFLRTILVSVDREDILLGCRVVGLLVLILFDYLLIPKFGIVGAALALGSSELFIFLAIWSFLLKKHFQLTNFQDAMTKVADSLSWNNSH